MNSTETPTPDVLHVVELKTREEDLVGITGAEWQSIENKISLSQSNLHKQLSDELKPKGWREWKDGIIGIVLIGAAGVVLHFYLPTAIAAANSDIAQRLAKVEESETHTQQDVADTRKKVEDTLNRFLDRIVPPQTEKPTTSSKATKPLDKRSAVSLGLPLMQLANDLDIALSPAAVERFSAFISSAPAPERRSAYSTIAAQLLKQSGQSTDYWRASFLLISSESSAFNSAPPRDTPEFLISNVTLVGQVMSLDHRNIVLDGGGLENFTIKNARIRFTQNPVKLKNVTFVNCEFVFPPNLKGPNPYLLRAVKTLLAADLSSVVIHSLG